LPQDFFFCYKKYFNAAKKKEKLVPRMKKKQSSCKGKKSFCHYIKKNHLGQKTFLWARKICIKIIPVPTAVKLR